jgi:hypothetical protein
MQSGQLGCAAAKAAKSTGGALAVAAGETGATATAGSRPAAAPVLEEAGEQRKKAKSKKVESMKVESMKVESMKVERLKVERLKVESMKVESLKVKSRRAVSRVAWTACPPQHLPLRRCA